MNRVFNCMPQNSVRKNIGGKFNLLKYKMIYCKINKLWVNKLLNKRKNSDSSSLCSILCKIENVFYH